MKWWIVYEYARLQILCSCTRVQRLPERFPFSCFFRCRSRLVCWPKHRSHRWHLKGFSLLWMLRMCRCRLDEMLKDRSQYLHLCRQIWGHHSANADACLHVNTYALKWAQTQTYSLAFSRYDGKSTEGKKKQASFIFSQDKEITFFAFKTSMQQILF